MSEAATADVAARIAEESAALPPDKQTEVLDFVLFIKGRVREVAASQGNIAPVTQQEDGDAAWERIINDPRPRPKLEEFMHQSRAEGGAEPLDLDRM
ncbi:MAG: hypothetical protein H0V56_10500 [Chthoniobacterales bacterium]|nr:hypothetical protein [Chthoniobacterales bacterium]